VINAEGEFQAAERLKQAAQIMAPFPMALQMRCRANRRLRHRDVRDRGVRVVIDLATPSVRQTLLLCDGVIGSGGANGKPRQLTPSRCARASDASVRTDGL